MNQKSNPKLLIDAPVVSMFAKVIRNQVILQTSKEYRGTDAKPGHLFYLVTCEWNHKNHWEVREIPVASMGKDTIAKMENQLKDLMVEKVVNYKP